MRLVVAYLSAALLTGCSIKQSVTPASIYKPASREICMIPALGLREGFHATYKGLLEQKGFSVRELRPGSKPSQCPLTTAYVGNWTWDLALYMVYADIKVYQYGHQVGQATYDAKWGGGRPDKFIDAEGKITELANQLFPNGAPEPEAKVEPVSTSHNTRLDKERRLQELMNDNSLGYEEYTRRRQAIEAE